MNIQAAIQLAREMLKGREYALGIEGPSGFVHITKIEVDAIALLAERATDSDTMIHAFTGSDVFCGECGETQSWHPAYTAVLRAFIAKMGEVK